MIGIESDLPLPFEEGPIGRDESPMPMGRAALASQPDLPPRRRRRLETLFSSARGDWGTPSDLLIHVLKEFPLGIDLAATAESAICTKFLGPGSPLHENALDPSCRWEGWGVEWGWLNPPYGIGVGKWVEKAFLTSLNGMGVVMLLPARTDTRWFHDFCLRGEIRFLRGRLTFVGAPSSAPFPSMLVIFRPPSPWVRMGALRG